MPKRSSKPESDLNTIAKGIVDQVTTQPDTQPSADLISQVMREMGRKGGLKGGKARASKLSGERRTEIARNAAIRRWTTE
jgi:hypothetical protein